ncbi:hypothetical protein NO1_1015 [Candidatus Termititenax aidoneus]|uniref:Uncharacterized protein n=1 Tax=Termititenax aidoneus TaxID=2218524 RepID=A0A388TCY7_TERA1|nr:hypothetical protein NO1_1015 [Candidatus Termititenax aidoneus]
MSIKSAFFQYSKNVYLENVARLETIKAIAADYKFEITEFDLAKDSVDKFKIFIEEIENKVGHISTVILTFSIVAGVRHWHEVLPDLDTFELIKNACQAALLKPENGNMSKADIVFKELERLNGRLAAWEKYDIANNFLPGLFSRTRRWKEVVNRKGEIIREEKRSLADCLPLTLYFYLAMSVLGEETEMWIVCKYDLDEKQEEVHVYSSLDGLKYENTKNTDIHTNKEHMYYSIRKTDVLGMLAENIVALGIKTSEEKTKENLFLSALALDEANTSALRNLYGLYGEKYFHTGDIEYLYKYTDTTYRYAKFVYESYMQLGDDKQDLKKTMEKDAAMLPFLAGHLNYIEQELKKAGRFSEEIKTLNQQLGIFRPPK